MIYISFYVTLSYKRVILWVVDQMKTILLFISMWGEHKAYSIETSLILPRNVFQEVQTIPHIFDEKPFFFIYKKNIPRSYQTSSKPANILPR